MVRAMDCTNVICGECGKRFREKTDKLKQFSVFQHDCGAYVVCDLTDLDAFLLDNANDQLAHFQLRAYA